LVRVVWKFEFIELLFDGIVDGLDGFVFFKFLDDFVDEGELFVEEGTVFIKDVLVVKSDFFLRDFW
jgi:hypothetical protein